MAVARFEVIGACTIGNRDDKWRWALTTFERSGSDSLQFVPARLEMIKAGPNCQMGHEPQAKARQITQETWGGRSWRDKLLSHAHIWQQRRSQEAGSSLVPHAGHPTSFRIPIWDGRRRLCKHVAACGGSHRPRQPKAGSN